MKKYKISQELKSYIEKILIERDIFYLYRGPNYISVDLSGKQYHKIVVRARCEKRNREENLCDGTGYWVPRIESKEELLKQGYNELKEYPKN